MLLAALARQRGGVVVCLENTFNLLKVEYAGKAIKSVSRNYEIPSASEQR
jgi:hypothetical protein